MAMSQKYNGLTFIQAPERLIAKLLRSFPNLKTVYALHRPEENSELCFLSRGEKSPDENRNLAQERI